MCGPWKTLDIIVYGTYWAIMLYHLLRLVGKQPGLRQWAAGHSEQGQGLVEYALILILVAVIVIAVLLVLGPSIKNIL